MSVIAELSIFPLGVQGSLAPYVAKAVHLIRESGLPHHLGPMGTCVEGEWDEVMAVVDQCFKALAVDQERVYMTLKVDWRAGRENGLHSKTASVESQFWSAR
ncbi:MTH1187 family thiamine-binding protein [Fundidesulfovibrio terrae]|uniref:MTH1187 family thiamine-binding protein n=1 Tax=Fundidesulfovibrio terrae TaxID=2922866 RepID=UPI001FAF634B|nr:MTH1187 family thiamine-binding protein [Fundidesulfovibrio terrae]